MPGMLESDRLAKPERQTRAMVKLQARIKVLERGSSRLPPSPQDGDHENYASRLALAALGQNGASSSS